MNKKSLLATSFVLAFSIPGSGIPQAQALTVDYGIVTKADMAQLSLSDNLDLPTAAGALLGGAVGYVFGRGSTKGKVRRGVAGGAAVGGFIANQATMGTRQTYEYTVKLLGGENITIATEQGHIDEGDCVAVERGESANIRRVSQVHCETDAKSPAPYHVTVANECEAAKAAMLEADTDEALIAAVNRARMLCED